VKLPDVVSTAAWDISLLTRLREALFELRTAALQLEAKHASTIAAAHPAFQASARNLVHYLSLRQHDLRDLQADLARLGLSSLGRSEPDVLSSLDAVISILERLLEREAPVDSTPADPQVPATLQVPADGWAVLDEHTEALLGPPAPRRRVRIMVTLPSEAASDPTLVRDIVSAGAESVRINCAHDDADAWNAMVANIRAAERELGTTCRILMDLAGPKLRTGSISPGPRVLHWRPKRDTQGSVVSPARVWLTAESSAALLPIEVDVSVSVAAKWLKRVHVGDVLEVDDLRGRTRRLRVAEDFEKGRLAYAETSAYVGAGASIRVVGKSKQHSAATKVGDVPAVAGTLTLQEGDTLILTSDGGPGCAAVYDGNDRLVWPARIACTLPEALRDVRAGERVLFDDGKIGGRIQSASPSELHIEITQARPDGSKLRADTGINFPESNLHVAALTSKDLEDLDFVAQHADMVGLSFAADPESILQMHAELAQRTDRQVGLVLKIETQRAFLGIPQLLLAAMRTYPAGVMIARGDLAVECGFERLAEVQEELLWLCEAAHVPTIWATQLLESLAQKGLPSRAEITDAAMSDCAECVMLNTGPYVVQAEWMLDNILCRMQEHQRKKRPTLRKLSVSTGLDSD
jgi:pyruvate kinase